MKQDISPAMMGVIIVIVIGLVGFLGYSLFLKNRSNAQTAPPEAQKWIDSTNHSDMKEHMQPTGPGGRPPGGGPPAGYNIRR